MDGARLSRYPHLAWLRFGVTGGPSSRPLVVGMHGDCHSVSLTARGCHHVRWITRGREQRWSEHAGAVHFVPADEASHTFVTAMSPDFVSQVLLLPRGHLDTFLVSEHVEPHADRRRLLAADDRVLRACVSRVFALGQPGDAPLDECVDEAARRLILRLTELCGGGTPDWHDDASVFDRRTLTGLVAHVDEHLKIAPSLEDMSLQTGLSPSHFAKKFRQSTGLSLHRFVNRRRIQRSLQMLQDDSQAIAGVALDLGFASQSHFTRLFSGLTGMTPARYRREFRPTMG